MTSFRDSDSICRGHRGRAMDTRSAARLRYLGILVIGICATLLLVPPILHREVKYDDAVAGTLAIGIGLLLLAEVGPVIKSLKAGGVEVEFLDTVTGKFNAIETRLAALEIGARHPERSRIETEKFIDERPKPPGIDTPSRYRDDPQKGRFGGASSREGFRLSAAFRNVTKNFVEIILTVDADRETGMESADCVDFYLHNSFDPDVVPAVFKHGQAEISLIAYGGFTVGAWIACRGIALELDLATMRGAPRIIRDL